MKRSRITLVLGIAAAIIAAGAGLAIAGGSGGGGTPTGVYLKAKPSLPYPTVNYNEIGQVDVSATHELLTTASEYRCSEPDPAGYQSCGFQMSSRIHIVVKQGVAYTNSAGTKAFDAAGATIKFVLPKGYVRKFSIIEKSSQGYHGGNWSHGVVTTNSLGQTIINMSVRGYESLMYAAVYANDPLNPWQTGGLG